MYNATVGLRGTWGEGGAILGRGPRLLKCSRWYEAAEIGQNRRARKRDPVPSATSALFSRTNTVSVNLERARAMEHPIAPAAAYSSGAQWDWVRTLPDSQSTQPEDITLHTGAKPTVPHSILCWVQTQTTVRAPVPAPTITTSTVGFQLLLRTVAAVWSAYSSVKCAGTVQPSANRAWRALHEGMYVLLHTALQCRQHSSQSVPVSC
jgi:hypothetical protein